MMLGAVDIGGTKIAIGLVTGSGQVVDSISLPTDPLESYHRSLGKVIQTLERLMQANKCSIAGIGIGATGRIRPDGSLLPNQFLPNWSDQLPAGDLGRHFNVTSAIENDADASALGEYLWGAGIGIGRLIYVTVSTGIGGGIVQDGKLYRGVAGCHPEIGHHVIDPQGPACFCGANGCWEQLASGTALAAWARENGGDGNWDARVVCDLAEQGNLIALLAVERESQYLGMGIANLITLFAPECIVLGGGLMQRWYLFSAAVEKVVQSQCGLVPWSKVKLAASSLQHPGLVGAAATWVHHFGD